MLLTACASSNHQDGPGVFDQADSSVVHNVRDLPRSRSGNAAVYTVFGKQYQVLESAKGFKERGIASWYGAKFHGRATSSGEIYDMYQMTAAHKHFPLPVFVRVSNLDNGQEIIVKVNDRGPFVHGRIIDLSFAAARALGIYEAGTANVEIEALTEAYRPGSQPQLAEATLDDTPAPVVSQPIAEQDAPGTAIAPRQTVAKSAPAALEKKYAWVVQLGAFEQAANATSMRARLDTNLAARSLISHDKRAQLYRLLIGPIASAEDADELRLRLASNGLDGYTLKARIQ